MAKSQKKSTSNTTTATIMSAGANFLAALAFLVGYFVTGSIYFLVAAVVIFFAGIAMIFVMSHMKKKFNLK
jgi:membrane protein YdbS with pleckstrin-like domain